MCGRNDADAHASRVIVPSVVDSRVGWQVTDAVFTNSIAKVSLLGAHDLATLAGHQPNATFKAVAEGLRILYDKQRDFHPAYICGDTGKEYNTTCVRCSLSIA